jgi:acetoin utilization deacetylase AcuC-like enzyme
VKLYAIDSFPLPLPEGHRFPIEKYALLRQRVIESGLARAEDIRIPPAATDEEILRVHDADYLQRLEYGLLTDAEVRRLGFPWSREMVERSRRSCGATVAASRDALTDSVAANMAGGTHHAFRDCGEGFCVLNDVAIAARAMQAEGRVRRVLILDTDVHQGNGTASIFGRAASCRGGDPTVFTFSIHGARNFPLRKEQSDLDVELPDDTGDEVYLEALERGLGEALAHAEAELVLHVSGADPYAGDRLGRLKLTKDGLARRDRLIYERCREAGLPVCVTMAGGYGRDLRDTVEIHLQTLLLAKQILSR